MRPSGPQAGASFRRKGHLCGTRSLPTRRFLLGGALAALAAPALRPAAAQGARVSILHLNDFTPSTRAFPPAAPPAGRTGPARAARRGWRGRPRRPAPRPAAEGRAAFLLDAGDQFMGSLYYTFHRGMAEAAVQRAHGHQAMSLGNHEFDNGPANLARYLAALPFPVLSGQPGQRGRSRCCATA